MTQEELAAVNSDIWSSAIAAIGLGSYTSVTLEGPAAIGQWLAPFLGERLSQVMPPTGAGFTFLGVVRSHEADCLEFPTRPRSAHIVKPKALTVEAFPDAPLQSFLLLELAPLQLSGVCGEKDDHQARLGREEVVELPSGDYIDRSHWTTQKLGFDEGGCAIPLPDEARLIVRWLRGKLLVVAKTSIWTRIAQNYDAPHNKMSAKEIRRAIESALPQAADGERRGYQGRAHGPTGHSRSSVD